MDLYQLNGFRVMELPVDASARDIARQVERFRILSRFGNGRNRAGALPLPVAPDEGMLRAAGQRLGDPESRILDELFWFWPHDSSHSTRDEALAALSAGDLAKAHSIWTKQGPDVGANDVTTHNLAVLWHAQALDWEMLARQRALEEHEIKRRDEYWQQAFEFWRALLQQESFWACLTTRIRAMNDPRLTTDMARRLRQSLPLALLLVNAKLAVRAAESKDANEATRQLRIMNGSGLDPALQDQALRRALQPVLDGIKMQCKAADDAVKQQAEHGYAATQAVIDNTKSLLAILDCLLPAGHPTREVAHDNVAECALATQVAYGNKTSDWKLSLELLDLTLPLAGSEKVRKRIEENIGTVKENLEFAAHHANCWFCGERSADKECASEVELYGNVRQFGTQITWTKVALPVPRCSVCKSAHDRGSTGIGLGGFIGGLLGIGSCVALDWGWGGILTLTIGIVLGCVIGGAIAGSKNPKGIKDESEKMKWPNLEKKLAEGWKVGTKPPNVE